MSAMKRKTQSIHEVIISNQDSEWLSDCDGLVGKLMKRARSIQLTLAPRSSDCVNLVRSLLDSERARSIQLTLAPGDLAWMRKQIREYIRETSSGDDPFDFTFEKHTDQGQIVIEPNYQRGLSKSIDQFIEIVESCPVTDKPVVAASLLKRLSRCTHIMSSGLCDRLDLPAGSTYAQGTRAVRSSAAQRANPKRASR